MKKLALLLLIPVVAFMPPSKEVKIKGHLQASDPVKMIYLSYRTTEGAVSDSSRLDDGKFDFEGKLDEPTLAFLTVRFGSKEKEGKTRFERMQLFLEPGKVKIDIKDSLKFARVNGSKAHVEFNRLNELQKPFEEKNRELRTQYMEYRKNKNEEGMKRIEQEMEGLDKKMKEEILYPYLLKNPSSLIALHVLKDYAGYDLDVKKIEPLFSSLPSSTRQWPSAIAFKEQIETAKKTSVGVYAMNFTQNDTLGRPVSLSFFKGKYVLIDFWASWCGPCRAENPNLVKAFHANKDKGFTVLSVSLDRPGKQQAWLDAIHKDGLTWTHVSDLNYWNNAVAKQYGINAIPQNLLVDPSGKIIAKNIMGEELQKKLGQVLK